MQILQSTAHTHHPPKKETMKLTFVLYLQNKVQCCFLDNNVSNNCDMTIGGLNMFLRSQTLLQLEFRQPTKILERGDETPRPVSIVTSHMPPFQ